MVRMICTLLLMLVCSGAASAGDLNKGDVAPPLLGKDRHGDVVDLAKLRGKVVVVTFWASWCTYCLKELPVLDVLQKHAGDKLLQVVAVNVKDSTQDYRLMMRQMGDYTIRMTRDRDGRIADGYGVNAYPNLWIIDPDGKVAAHHRGYTEDALDRIIDDINRVLREQAARPAAAAKPTAG